MYKICQQLCVWHHACFRLHIRWRTNKIWYTDATWNINFIAFKSVDEYFLPPSKFEWSIHYSDRIKESSTTSKSKSSSLIYKGLLPPNLHGYPKMLNACLYKATNNVHASFVKKTLIVRNMHSRFQWRMCHKSQLSHVSSQWINGTSTEVKVL